MGAQEETQPLQLIADLEREVELLLEAAKAEAQGLVEAARAEADAALRVARDGLRTLEQVACEREFAAAQARADAIRAAWAVHRGNLEEHLRNRMPDAIRLIVEAVLTMPPPGKGDESTDRR